MPADLTSLANFGFSAIVLGWVLLRLEPRFERLERSVDRLAKAVLLEVATDPARSDAAREQSRSLIREIEDRSGGNQS